MIQWNEMIISYCVFMLIIIYFVRNWSRCSDSEIENFKRSLYLNRVPLGWETNILTCVQRTAIQMFQLIFLIKFRIPSIKSWISPTFQIEKRVFSLFSWICVVESKRFGVPNHCRQKGLSLSIPWNSSVLASSFGFSIDFNP